MTQTSDTFDAASSLRIVTCATCGILFAIPESLHIQRSLEHGLIHCPNGHQIPLQKPSKTTLNMALVAELAQVKHLLAMARKALARLGPPSHAKPVDAREMKRRLNLLVARAEQLRGSQARLCPICASRHGNERVLRIHIRKHKQDIRRMPASEFGNR